MAAFNQITIVGNLGRDPEIRYIPSGKAVTNFSVAVTEKYNDNENTTWFNVVAWEKLAETCANYLSKGSPVLISGKMQCRKWEDKENNKRETWEIRAFSMQMLGKGQGKKDDQGQRQTGNRGPSPGSNADDRYQGPPADDGDIPF